MDAALDQGSVQAIGPRQGLADGPGGVGPAELAVFAERVAAERQDGVQPVPARTEDVWLADVPGRVHRPLDENDNVVADLMLILKLHEGIAEPLPFRDAGRGVRDIAVEQQMVDLRPGKPVVRVGEDFAERFGPFGKERGVAFLDGDSHEVTTAGSRRRDQGPGRR